jgi:hypothetical protein
MMGSLLDGGGWYFTPRQQNATEFVDKRGGGLLFLGGRLRSRMEGGAHQASRAGQPFFKWKERSSRTRYGTRLRVLRCSRGW